MFGIGGSEIIVILVVALLFLGPDKLPDAAKKISKGIRDIKKQSRILQQQIENDERIGGAIRDLKSALRDEPAFDRTPQIRKPPIKKKKPAALPKPADEAAKSPDDEPADAPADDKPAVTLPATAGEANPDVKDETKPEELAALIKPASGTIAKSEPAPEPEAAAAEPKQKHG
ncbi:MAG TPA: twin-arginine translocase TatA/TatE family subunit [Kofleriaceae bacterium]|nr:twin-arginine translocase TatA/TatE family subunit [Kofleriaceae bacterium]